jgi:hypothetical protein
MLIAELRLLIEDLNQTAISNQKSAILHYAAVP